MRGRTWWLPGLLVAMVVVAGAVALAVPRPVAGCLSAPVPADVAIDDANAIALVRLVATDGDVATFAYHFVVEEALKGTLDRNLRTSPLRSGACGDTISGPIGSRFVIALAVATGAGALLNPYWVVDPGGRLTPVGIDDTTTSATVGDLRAAIAARLGTLGTIIPDEATTRPIDAGVAAGSVAIVLAGVAILFGVAVALRRRVSS